MPLANLGAAGVTAHCLEARSPRDAIVTGRVAKADDEDIFNRVHNVFRQAVNPTDSPLRCRGRGVRQESRTSGKRKTLVTLSNKKKVPCADVV